MTNYLPYDPGVLPTKAPPAVGEVIKLTIQGLPPYKDTSFSIRNARHRSHSRFTVLRQTAITGMNGRAPFRGAVSLTLAMHAKDLEKGKSITDYMAGIMDSLDGSHGVEFTYLPIVYEDDCQVADGQERFVEDVAEWYELEITFLEDKFEESEQVSAPDAEEYRAELR